MNLEKILLNITKPERYRRSLRRALRKDAEAFNKRIYNFIEGREYPLRRRSKVRGYNPNASRIEPGTNRTATERLHGTTLKEGAMSPRFEKHRNRFTILFRNQAPHAIYFFEPTSPHHISGNPLLSYWAGYPLPWDPPAGGSSTPSLRRTRQVRHPGTEGYSKYILDEFDKQYRRRFIKKASESIDRIFLGSL